MTRFFDAPSQDGLNNPGPEMLRFPKPDAVKFGLRHWLDSLTHLFSFFRWPYNQRVEWPRIHALGEPKFRYDEAPDLASVDPSPEQRCLLGRRGGASTNVATTKSANRQYAVVNSHSGALKKISSCAQ